MCSGNRDITQQAEIFTQHQLIFMQFVGTSVVSLGCCCGLRDHGDLARRQCHALLTVIFRDMGKAECIKEFLLVSIRVPKKMIEV